MQEVVNRIDDNVEFIVQNGDKKWFMYELILALNQAIYEFSAYLSGDPSMELSATTLHTTKLDSSPSRMHFDTNKLRMKVGDLEPSPMFKDLYMDFMKNTNNQVCDKIMGMIKFREDFNQNSKEIYKLRNMMVDANGLLRKDLIRYNGYGIQYRKNRERNYYDVERSLGRLRQLEDRYLSHVAEFEKVLGDGHEDFNNTLTLLTNLHNYCQSQFVRVCSKEYFRIRKGLSRFLRNLLKTSSDLKKENYMLDKHEKLDKVQEIYGQLSNKVRNFQFDRDWPPFQRYIDDLNFEDTNDIKRMLTSFNTLIESFEQYFTQDIEVNSKFFEMLDRIDSVDSKMLTALKTFEKTQYECEHPFVQKMLKNLKEIRVNIRKITVKCFGVRGTNSQHLRKLLEEKIKYREYSYKKLGTIKSRLKGYGNEYKTEEFWNSMSFKFYDYINRIFVKASSINVEFLRKYDQSLNYTCAKLSNIIELLKENENLCMNKKIRQMDLGFKETCFERKKELAELFPSILVDDRLLMEVIPLQKGRMNFHFHDVNDDIVINPPNRVSPNVMEGGVSLQNDIRGSPATEDHSNYNANFLRFSPDQKNFLENKGLMKEFKEEFKFGIQPKNPDYEYNLIAEKLFLGVKLEDYINTVFVDRKLKLNGKTYKSFIEAIALENGNELLKSEKSYPNLKQAERTGFIRSRKYVEVKEIMKVKVPFGKGHSTIRQNYNYFIFSPKSAANIVICNTEDVPNGKDLTIFVLNTVKETGRGVKVEYYSCFNWKSRPFVAGIIEKFAKSAMEESIKKSLVLTSQIFQQNSTFRPDSKISPINQEDQKPDLFNPPTQYAEEIQESREKRARVLNEFEAHKFEFERIKNMESLKARREATSSSAFDYNSSSKGKVILFGLIILVLLKIWSDQQQEIY